MDWGSTVPYKQWDTLAKGFWARVGRRSRQETEHDWLGGQGFPYKASKSIF